jgi:hypothetical protein
VIADQLNKTKQRPATLKLTLGQNEKKNPSSGQAISHCVALSIQMDLSVLIMHL